MHRKTIAILLNSVLLAALLCFIWGNSLQNQASSAAESGRILALLTRLLSPLLGQDMLTEHMVRKLAHFSEFAALGFFTIHLCAVCGRKNIHYICHSAAFGLACAVTDESLQMLNDRSAQVSDVLIDFSGVLVGMAVFFILTGLCWLFLRQNKRKH